jgi:hypothetical protein
MAEHVRVMYIPCYDINLVLQRTVAIAHPIRAANTDGKSNICDAHNSGLQMFPGILDR